jgi:hypothetical protein
MVKGDQFYCTICNGWWADNARARHLRDRHNGAKLANPVETRNLINPDSLANKKHIKKTRKRKTTGRRPQKKTTQKNGHEHGHGRVPSASDQQVVVKNKDYDPLECDSPQAKDEDEEPTAKWVAVVDSTTATNTGRPWPGHPETSRSRPYHHETGHHEIGRPWPYHPETSRPRPGYPETGNAVTVRHETVVQPTVPTSINLDDSNSDMELEPPSSLVEHFQLAAPSTSAGTAYVCSTKQQALEMVMAKSTKRPLLTLFL